MVSIEPYLNYITQELIPRFSNIIKSPWLNSETLWMVIPLIVILFFIQAYFGRNKTEQLGWNTAYGNAVSLLWISVLLTKFVIESSSLKNLFFGGSLRSLILIGILLTWTLLLLISDYFHAIPKKLAFLLSSAIPVTVTAYVFVVLIIGKIPIDKTTLIASILFLICISIFFKLFRTIITPSDSSKVILEKRHVKEMQKKYRKKQKLKKKIEEIKERTYHFFDFLKPREPRL